PADARPVVGRVRTWRLLHVAHLERAVAVREAVRAATRTPPTTACPLPPTLLKHWSRISFRRRHTYRRAVERLVADQRDRQIAEREAKNICSSSDIANVCACG